LAWTAPDAAGGIFNIGRGQRHTLLEVIARLEEITGHRSRLRYLPSYPGDILHSQADISQARERLGYALQRSLAVGLHKTARWFYKNCGNQVVAAIPDISFLAQPKGMT
jgi:nucleoside-diphosphate-sugar epimerase